MADALMGVTETSAASHAEVSKLAQTFLTQQAKLAATITTFSSLAVPGAASIELPRSGGFTVGSKSENTKVDSQIVTWEADTISLDQHRVIQFVLEDKAAIQSNVATVKDAIMKATKALALDMDTKIIVELRLASSSAPDHLIKFTDTTNEDIELGDILAARKLLIDQNIDPRECFMGVGSDQEKFMLAIDNFISAEKYGSNEPILNGEIGKIYGMKVIVHTGFNQEALFWHPSAVGFAIQQGTRFQTESALSDLGTRYSLDYIAGFEVLDGGVRQVQISETA